jgi:ribosomal subunit interface protein
MKAELTTHHMEDDSVIRDHFQERVERLKKYIMGFKDESIHLHGTLDKNPHKEEFYASLSLYLPSVVLHCREQGLDCVSALNSAFSDMIKQVKKRKEKLGRQRRCKEVDWEDC